MRQRSLSNAILRHLMDESFNFGNLIVRDYTPETVEHLLRYHYVRLRSLRDDGDLDAVVVYTDLTSALNSLPDDHRKVVLARIGGNTLSMISHRLDVNAARLAKEAYRFIAVFLNGSSNSPSGDGVSC